MSIIYTTPILEYPPMGGPQLRVENSIRAIARVTPVHLVPRVTPDALGGAPALAMYKEFCASVTFVPSCTLRPGRKTLLQAAALRAVRADARYLLHIADLTDASAIWCGYGNISFSLMRDLKALRPSLKVLCDTDSVWSRFVGRGLPYEKNPLRKLDIVARSAWKQQQERWWVNHCDSTFAVSEVDAMYYRGLARDPSKVCVFENVINLASYQRSVPAPPVEKPYLILSGTFGPRSPMDDAARWLTSKVLPLLRRRGVNARLVIAGRGSKETLADLGDSTVSIIGQAPSLLPWLSHAAVSVVPLRFESGTRFKILEAAACGVPVVSTTLGAEGLAVTSGMHCLIADEPAAFAEAIFTFLASPQRSMDCATELRRLVVDNYSVEALSRRAASTLRSHGVQPVAT